MYSGTPCSYCEAAKALLKSKNVANHKQGEQLIKAGIGSMMLGLPTTLQEQPIEIQMYQYLLGGFFGYNARPSYEKAAKELNYKIDDEYLMQLHTWF